MIVLLGCSISSFAIESINPSTGEVDVLEDSVLIAYNDLRLANSKLIQLEYEQRINRDLKAIVTNDSIIIDNYADLTKRLNNDCKKSVRQRNVCLGVAIVGVIASIILIIK